MPAQPSVRTGPKDNSLKWPDLATNPHTRLLPSDKAQDTPTCSWLLTAP